MFILCAGLGFIPSPEGGGKAFLVLAALAFFVPGGILLYRGKRTGDAPVLRRLRNLSALSLGATLALLVVNFLSVRLSETAGQVVFWILTVVSTPMVCGQFWVMSLFLWACLLIGSISYLKK